MDGDIKYCLNLYNIIYILTNITTFFYICVIVTINSSLQIPTKSR